MDITGTISRRTLAALGAAAAATLAAAGPSQAASRHGATPTAGAVDGGTASLTDYTELVPNRDAPRRDWDWSAALQAAVDENAGRVIHVPDEGERYVISKVIKLRENTTLVGDEHSRIYIIGNPGRADGVFQLREQKVIDNPTTEFSRNVRFTGLEFEREPEQARRNKPIIWLVNLRGVTVDRCRFINCGGLNISHELAVGGHYNKANTGESGDPCVEAGFNPNDTEDLNEDIVFTNNYIDGRQPFVKGVRLNWVKRAVVVNNICKYADISWWGGPAPQHFGGTLKNLRRCVQFLIANNYVSWTDGAIYGNQGAQLTITGNVAEYIRDVAFDMEGCTDYVIDGNVARYVGNFCYSVLYASDNGVFSNNVAIQGHKGKGIGTIGANLGRHVFRRVAKFDDDGSLGPGLPGPKPGESRPHQFAIRGNTFIWEEDTGFGVFGTGGFTQSDITGNTFHNVVIEGYDKDMLMAEKYAEVFHGNRLTFTNKTKEDDVYMQFGDQRAGQNVVSIKNNTVRIANAHPKSIPLVVQQGYPRVAPPPGPERKNKLSVVSGNVIDADTEIAIGYVDWLDVDQHDAEMTKQKQYFEFVNNKVRGGVIKNLTTHTRDSTVVNTRNNTDFKLTSIRLDERPDTKRWATLYFGEFVGTDDPPEPPPSWPDPPAGRQLAAVGATASDFIVPHAPVNALDKNDLYSRWQASGVPQWIRFDLGEVHPVHALTVKWGASDVRVYTFDLHLSTNGKDWTTVLSKQKSTHIHPAIPQTYEFHRQEARYVRIVCHGNDQNDQSQVKLVEFFVAP